MSGQREVLPDWAKASKKRLRATRIAKAAHLAFAPAAEPEIPANRAADDDGREAVTVIKRFRFLHHFILPPTPH